MCCLKWFWLLKRGYYWQFPKGLIYYNPTLVQIMAWCRRGQLIEVAYNKANILTYDSGMQRFWLISLPSFVYVPGHRLCCYSWLKFASLINIFRFYIFPLMGTLARANDVKICFWESAITFVESIYHLRFSVFMKYMIWQTWIVNHYEGTVVAKYDC